MVTLQFNHYRYKHELAEALQREEDLQRAKTQLDLDWQRRYESVEREQYEKAENLIKKLTQAREEVSHWILGYPIN